MTEHNIRIMCPNVICRKVMTVPTSGRGKIVQCPQCRKRLRIPQTVTTPTFPTVTPIEPESDPAANRKAG